MKDPDLDRDARPGNDVIGNARDPLPEPWFIREARERKAAAPIAREPVAPPPVVAAGAIPGIVYDPPAARVPPAPAKPWRLAIIIGLGILAAIIVVLLAMPKQGGAPPVEALPEDGETVATVPTTVLDCASPAAIARLRDVIVGQARGAGGDGAGSLDARAAGLSVSVAAMQDNQNGDGRTLMCRGLLSLPQTGDAAPVSANVVYRLRPAANATVDVSGVAGAGPIVEALARPPQLAPEPAVVPEAEAPEPPEPEPVPPPQAAPRAVTTRTTTVRAPASVEPVGDEGDTRPSFNCRGVTSRVLQAICASPRLAALDVEMSELFYAVRADADRETRDELEESRADFIARRQSCRDDRCIARTYRDRIAELEAFP